MPTPLLPPTVRLPGLRAARQAAELTQAQLAEALKVSPSTISHIERGGHISRDLARALAWKLFVPVEDLRRTPREARPSYLRLMEQSPAIAVGLDLAAAMRVAAHSARSTSVRSAPTRVAPTRVASASARSASAAHTPRLPALTAEQAQAIDEAQRLYDRQRIAFEQARDAGLLGDPQVNKRLYCLTGEAVAAIQRCRDLGAPWQGPKLSSGRQSGQARRR